MNVREYWEQKNVISMSDKRVSNLESEIIAKFIEKNDNVLNVGCGDGTGCFKYREKCKSYTGIERSSEMVKRFKSQSNHPIIHKDIFDVGELNVFSCVVSQRCLINLENRSNQKKALDKMINWLGFGGKLIICEAFEDGLNNLNDARKKIGVKPITPHWHALYLTDDFFNRKDLKLISEKDLSGYFLLTRVLHAALTDIPLENSKINEYAEKLQLEDGNFQSIKNFSFIKIKIFEKC